MRWRYPIPAHAASECVGGRCVLAEGIVVRPRTPLEPLKAQTINVAYQYGAQASKGSLEAGKLADLAILDGNP